MAAMHYYIVLAAAITISKAQNLAPPFPNATSTISGTMASSGFGTALSASIAPSGSFLLSAGVSSSPSNSINGTSSIASSGFTTSARATATIIILTAEDSSKSVLSSTSELTASITSTTTIPSSTQLTSSTLISETVYPTTTTASTASSTTSSISSTLLPSQTPLTCPESNGTFYEAQSGQTFEIECDIDHYAGDLAMDHYESLRECIDACDLKPSCVDVSMSGSACYMKSVLGSPIPAPGLLGAKLANVTTPTPPINCPGSDSTLYTTSDSNSTFIIECGVDYAGGDLAAVDVGSTQPNGNGNYWLQDCVELCGNTESCIDVSLAGSTCYMKSTLGAKGYNSYIFGARLLSPLPSTTTSMTATSTPASSSTSPAAACDTNSPTCPACNGTTLMTQDSEPTQAYRVECGIDHAGGDIGGEAAEHVGMAGPRRFRNCIEDCAETDGCIDVSFQGSQCFLKSSVGAVVYSDVVWGAIRVA